MFTKYSLFHILVFAIIAGAVVLGYHHTLSVPFIFDDFHAIEENLKIRDPGNFLTLDSLRAQRPLVDLSFALNYHLGGVEVFGYHLFNLIIHFVSACLVYLLALVIFRRLDEIGYSTNGRQYLFVVPAAFVALVFALHPVQTQAVTYIVQRYTSMAAMFYLASVLCYILGRQAMMVAQARKLADTGQTQPKIPFTSPALFALCFVLGMASFLSKQIAISLPLTILLVEYFMFDRTWAGWKKKLVLLTPLCIAFFLFALYSAGVLQGEISLGRVLEETDQRTRETLEVSRLQYLLTQFQVIPIYLGLLIWPVNLSLDYMYPFVDSLFRGWTFWGFLLLVILAGAGVGLCKFLPALSLGIFWIFITLSVESSLIPISDALFEHRLYLPMFGFALILGWAFNEVYRRWQVPALVLGIFVLIILAVVTYQRNAVWLDPVTLWADTLNNRPNNPRAHNNLGQALEKQERIWEAARHYQKALKLRPGYAEVHLNLGLVLAKAGRIEQAAEHFEYTVKLRPGMAKAHYNLGLARQARGRHQEAIDHYRRALLADPDMVDARLNLAGALAQTNRPQKAIEQLNKILDQNPDHFDAMLNKGTLLFIVGSSHEALEILDIALKIEPDSVQAMMNQGIILMRTGNPEQALQSFARILNLEPENVQARQWLVNAMREAGKEQ